GEARRLAGVARIDQDAHGSRCRGLRGRGRGQRCAGKRKQGEGARSERFAALHGLLSQCAYPVHMSLNGRARRECGYRPMGPKRLETPVLRELTVCCERRLIRYLFESDNGWPVFGRKAY